MRDGVNSLPLERVSALSQSSSGQGPNLDSQSVQLWRAAGGSRSLHLTCQVRLLTFISSYYY
jgi:hypothetical protein